MDKRTFSKLFAIFFGLIVIICGIFISLRKPSKELFFIFGPLLITAGIVAIVLGILILKKSNQK